jgi:hypothetical protein
MFDRWQWLAGTYWYVPAVSLLAPLFSRNRKRPMWLSDQTVWQIMGYKNGYFWGYAAVRMEPAAGGESAQPVAQVLTASVTPEGNVHMTFMPVKSSGGSPGNVGIGHMRWGDGAWTAQMQMSSTPSDDALLLHWANMVQCGPGDAAWQQLPGTSQSVPAFLESAGLPVPKQPPSPRPKKHI